MAYSPTTDFLALLRQTSGGVRTARVPGSDYVLEALARLGLINVAVGQSAPAANQVTTAWFRPALPSWSGEGTLFLWNVATSGYELATPALWIAFLAPIVSGYVFQSIGVPAGAVQAGASLCAIRRASPAATSLLLPNLAGQFASGRKLQIVDFSTNVTNHTITLTTSDGSTIMQAASFQLLSSAAQLAGVTLTPAPELNSWVITP